MTLDNDDGFGGLLVAMVKFTRDAIKRFEETTDENEKKSLIRAISSNLSLKDKKLHFQIQEPFLLIKKGYYDMYAENSSLEPARRLFLQPNSQFFSKKSNLGPLRDVPRTYFSTLSQVELLKLKTSFLVV